MYPIHFYKTRRGDYPVKDFVQKLSKKSRAKVWRYVELLEKHGPNLLRPYADSVGDKVRELRVRVVEGNIRILYFFFMGRNAVLLHALKKKTSELPKKEIEQAKQRMKDFILRHDQGEFEL
jgi:phage-related protein